jgi:general secretion pathway protein D
LRDLISVVGNKLNKHFVIDPRVRGSADLGALKLDSVTYHILLEVLGVHGFVAIPSGDVVTVIPDVYARSVATPLVSVDDIRSDDAEVVTVIIPLKSGDAVKYTNMLRPMVPQWGWLAPAPDQNALLVVDKVANIKRIVAVIRSQESAK